MPGGEGGERARGRSRSSTRARAGTRIGGVVRLPDQDASFPRGMEDPFPLPNMRVRLFDLAAPDADVAATTTNARGRFSFTAEEVGERDPAGLGLEVLASSPGCLTVCREDRDTPWSFRVAGQDVAGAAPEVTAALGPRMELDVPTFTASARVWRMTGDAVRGEPEQHQGNRAFHAFAVLMRMRSWLWNQGANTAHFSWIRRQVWAIYPSDMSWFNPRLRQLHLDSPGPRDDGHGQRPDFNNSWLAHEFGHVLWLACAPDAAQVAGSHAGVVSDARRCDRTRLHDANARRAALEQARFRYGLAIDFSEGFATFVGQSFLGSSRYEDERTTHDLERSPACQYGDWATASYLLDLVDDGAGGRSDDEGVALGFCNVVGAFEQFAQERGAGRFLVLPDFHEFLLGHDVRAFMQRADEVLEQNRLGQVRRDWLGLDRAYRDEVVGRRPAAPPPVPEGR